MAKSNVNDDLQNVLAELKDMSGILSSKVGESVKDKTKAKAKQGMVDGVKEGVKGAKNIPVDVSNIIDVDTKSIEKNTGKQVANALNNGVKSAQSQIKSITISPKITISPEDIDYAKIKRELDKELKKANRGTSVNNKRYLDLMQTSADIGNFLAPKYYEYKDIAEKQVGDYSPKNIIQEFVDATKIIEQQNRIWQQAIEYLLEYQSAAKNAAKANRDIIPYQGDKTSIYIDGMDTTKNSGYRNVTQKSLKAHLKDYIANPSQENFDVLAAYTNAFGNIQKAEEIFGKKHAKLFSQIIEYIEQAKISTNDYKEAQIQLKLALQSLGVESIKLGQFDKLYDILSGQDLKAGVEYIEKELGIEIPKAVKEAFDSGDITSFLHSIKQVEEEVDKTEEELNETAEAGEKAKRAVQWIRGETGGADIQQDAYTEAINKFTNVKVRNSVDADGNPQTETAQYVNMDKLAKEIIKHDTEILNLEYRIKNAQGDTSGLEENLGILKQQRSEYERFLDDKIADPYYETNESQKEILLQQRAINEEMIRNEQYTKNVVIQEKERVRLKEEQKKLYIQMQEASSAKQVEQEKVKQQNLNILLSEQRQAYKNIYNIKTSIAKLDPTKNALEIAELERQKKIEVDIYGEKTRAIKAIDAQAHAEAHVNELYNIRKKALNEIAQIQSRKLDKSSASVQEQETKASAKAAEAEAEAIAKRNKERRKLQDKANLNVADTHNKEAIALYQTLIKQADEYYTLLEQEKRGELEGNKTAQNRLAELKIAWEKATQGVEEYSTAVKGSTTYIDKLDVVRSIFKNSDQGVALDYSKSLQDMEKNLRAIADGDKYIASIKEEAKGLAEQIHKINSEPIDLKADGAIEDIAKLNGDYQEFLNKIETSDAKAAAGDTIAKLDVQIEEFMQKNSKMGRQFRQEFESLKIRLDASESKQEVKDIVTELNRLKASVYEANKTGKSFFANLGNRIRQMSTNFLAMYLSLYDVVRYVRTAYETIKQLDTALVDLKKTTTMSNSELEEFYMDSSNIAKQMGTSTEQIISQAAAWSRLGYSSKEAATEMAALSSQFAAISPGTSVDNATDYLVSTMKAFHIAVDNVESDIMDPINRLGNTMATSNQEIGEMLKRSSAAMAAANNSLAETAALESAAVQITRNAETTGTAFRTISMRIRGYDEETEEFIGNVEQLSGDIADLTKTAKNSGGISLFTDETKSTYKSTYQLLKDIAGIWDDLSDKQQASLLEKLAGKRGGQVLAGILDDFSEVERAMSEIEKSAGSADKEMGIIEESIEYKVNALKQTWVNTLQQMIDRGQIGKLVDGLTDLSEVLGFVIDKVGLLGTIGVGVGIFGGIKAFKNSDNILGTLTKFSQLGEIVDLGKNGVNTLETVSKIADAIIDMDDAQKIAVISAMKLSEVQATQVLLTAGVKSETIEAAVAQGTLATSENVTTGSTISLSNAYRGLAASLGISTAALTAFIAAAAGIAIGISAWIAYKQHIKETAIAAAESAEAIQEEQSAIDGQISKYKELKEKLKDINLTEDEQYEIKKQLYELQKSLNETYGDEATKLDLVNGKYETQLELLRQISQEQAQGYIQEHQFDYSKAENRLNTVKNRTLNFSDVQADIDPRIIKYLRGYSGLRDLNEDGSGPAAFSIRLNDEEAEATLRKLYDDVERFGKNTGANVKSTLGVISKHITDITTNETFQADKKFVAEFNKQAVLADDNLRSVYAKGLDAVEQYNKALAMNDGISEARKNLNAVRSEFDLYKNNVSGSEEVFQSVWDNINTSAERTLLIEERLSDKTTHAFELAEKLKGVNDFELKDIDFDSANLNEGEQAFVDLANSLGIDADNTQGLIDKLVELGFAIGSTTDKVEELGEASEDSFNFTKDISDLKDLEDELNKLGTAMSNIDEAGTFQLGDLDSIADYFLAIEEAGGNAAYKAEEVGDALKLLGEGTGSIEQQADAINTLADQYIRTSNVLAGLNEQNKQLYITRLEEMGIINAEIIVEQELLAAKNDVINAQTVEEASTIDLTNFKEALVAADEDAINATIAEIQALLDESNATDATRAAVFNLVAQQTVFNTQGLDVNGKIEALERLANAFLTTAEAARFEAEMSTVASQAKNMSKAGGMPSDVAAKINKNVENKTKQFSASIGKQTVTFEKAQYNGGSSVKNKLGTTPTSTGGALKDLRNKAAQDAADKAGGGGSSKDPTEEAKKDEEELEDTYDEFFDYFERRLKVVSDAISLLDAHLENVVGSNAKNTLLDAQMRIYKMQQQEYADAQNMYQEMADRALAKIEDSNIVEKIKNGAVGIDEFIGKGNEEVVNAINDYTKWADKVADCKQQLAELKETIRQLELTRMKNILQDWQDVFDLRQDNAIDLIDKQISLIEESGNLVGKAFYEQQKRQTEGQLSAMEQAKRELSAELNRGLANGSIEVGTDEWIEEVGLLQEVESNILDCKQAIEEYDNAILAIHTDTFDRLIDKFDDLDDELSDIAAFFDDEKVGDKFGNWSEAGQAQAGLLAQQYELAQNKVKKYAEQIDWLNGQYNAGKYSTTEYTEQLAELMDAMRESAKDAESAKEAMLDLNKVRIDIVIDGINEEIEAYSDLISKEKDALSAEKDLHDYRKQIAESNKSIVAIQKQLAAIENDNSQKARAQRAKLQQQLKDAQDALAEQEYDHSVEMQQQALDEQLEQYKDTRQKEIDELNAYVENSQQVLTDMFENVRANAESIGQTIVQTAQEHGFQVSTSLTESWKAGENAIASYGAVLTPATSEFIAQLENVEQQTWDLQDQADKTAVSLADMFGTRADTLVGELQRSWQAEANAQAMADALRQSMVYALESGYDISSVVSSLNSVANAAKDVAEAANDAAGALDNAISKQNAFNNMPKSSDLTHYTTIYNNPNANQVNWDYIGGHTSLNSSKSSNSYSTTIPGLGKKTKKHARGLSKAEQDELAWTQELGDEIIISPTRNSILTPIKKNDSVLTAEMTKNLFELAKINPNDILQGSGAKVVAPQIESTNNSVSIGNLVNVEGSISSENLDAVKATIQSELKKTFRNINSGLRR